MPPKTAWGPTGSRQSTSRQSSTLLGSAELQRKSSTPQSPSGKIGSVISRVGNGIIPLGRRPSSSESRKLATNKSSFSPGKSGLLGNNEGPSNVAVNEGYARPLSAGAGGMSRSSSATSLSNRSLSGSSRESSSSVSSLNSSLSSPTRRPSTGVAGRSVTPRDTIRELAKKFNVKHKNTANQTPAIGLEEICNDVMTKLYNTYGPNMYRSDQSPNAMRRNTYKIREILLHINLGISVGAITDCDVVGRCNYNIKSPYFGYTFNPYGPNDKALSFKISAYGKFEECPLQEIRNERNVGSSMVIAKDQRFYTLFYLTILHMLKSCAYMVVIGKDSDMFYKNVRYGNLITSYDFISTGYNPFDFISDESVGNSGKDINKAKYICDFIGYILYQGMLITKYIQRVRQSNRRVEGLPNNSIIQRSSQIRVGTNDTRSVTYVLYKNIYQYFIDYIILYFTLLINLYMPTGSSISFTNRPPMVYGEPSDWYSVLRCLLILYSSMESYSAIEQGSSINTTNLDLREIMPHIRGESKPRMEHITGLIRQLYSYTALRVYGGHSGSPETNLGKLLHTIGIDPDRFGVIVQEPSSPSITVEVGQLQNEVARAMAQREREEAEANAAVPITGPTNRVNPAAAPPAPPAPPTPPIPTQGARYEPNEENEENAAEAEEEDARRREEENKANREAQRKFDEIYRAFLDENVLAESGGIFPDKSVTLLGQGPEVREHRRAFDEMIQSQSGYCIDLLKEYHQVYRDMNRNREPISVNLLKKIILLYGYSAYDLTDEDKSYLGEMFIQLLYSYLISTIQSINNGGDPTYDYYYMVRGYFDVRRMLHQYFYMSLSDNCIKTIHHNVVIVCDLTRDRTANVLQLLLQGEDLPRAFQSEIIKKFLQMNPANANNGLNLRTTPLITEVIRSNLRSYQKIPEMIERNRLRIKDIQSKILSELNGTFVGNVINYLNQNNAGRDFKSDLGVIEMNTYLIHTLLNQLKQGDVGSRRVDASEGAGGASRLTNVERIKIKQFLFEMLRGIYSLINHRWTTKSPNNQAPLYGRMIQLWEGIQNDFDELNRGGTQEVTLPNGRVHRYKEYTNLMLPDYSKSNRSNAVEYFRTLIESLRGQNNPGENGLNEHQKREMMEIIQRLGDYIGYMENMNLYDGRRRFHRARGDPNTARGKSNLNLYREGRNRGFFKNRRQESSVPGRRAEPANSGEANIGDMMTWAELLMTPNSDRDIQEILRKNQGSLTETDRARLKEFVDQKIREMGDGFDPKAILAMIRSAGDA